MGSVLVRWEKERRENVERLEERIRWDGVVEDGEVLKVDSFLNHQLDVELFTAMGKEWARLFAGTKIDKIFTAVVAGAGWPSRKRSSLVGIVSGQKACGWRRWPGSGPCRQVRSISAEQCMWRWRAHSQAKSRTGAFQAPVQ